MVSLFRLTAFQSRQGSGVHAAEYWNLLPIQISSYSQNCRSASMASATKVDLAMATNEDQTTIFALQGLAELEKQFADVELAARTSLALIAASQC